MEVKFDKEKVDKIIEKMQKISEVNAEYAKVISKYTLSDKEVEYLNALSTSLAKREKTLGKLSNSMESLLKDWNSYSSPSEKSLDLDEDEKPLINPSTPLNNINTVNIPIATPTDPIYIIDEK